MTFQRIIFIFCIFLCAGAIIAAYSYRTLVLNPELAATRSQSMGQVDSLGNSAESSTTIETVPTVDLPVAAGTNEEDFETTTTEEPEISQEMAEVINMDAAGILDTDANSQQIIFDDTLLAEWQNWSWDTTVDLANAAPVGAGKTSIAITFDSAWGAMWLATYENIYRDDYDILRFWIHGGDSGGQAVKVSLADGNQGLLDQNLEIVVAANEWQQIDIPLTELDAAEEIGGISWQEASGSNQQPLFIDQVSFVKLSIANDLAAQDAAQGSSANTASNSDRQDYSNVASQITIKIDVEADRHEISPEIYGINYGDDALVSDLGHTIRRWGGNATTRYNWKLDVANRASDWFFENIAEEVQDLASLPRGSTADRFVAQNQAAGVKTIMTMPMIGWTPKSRDFACGFSVSKYGPQQSVDQWQPDCGNGNGPNGESLTADPTDTSIAIDPTFVSEWIGHLVQEFGTAASGGVTHYNLDNEPMLWNHAHRDVHPDPVGYDELYERTINYAAAIKRADPSAMTLGPALWGWSAYEFSALDLEEGGGVFNRNPDRAAHGDMPLIPWYLQQLARYEQENGIRLLDYLDVHYYPQAQGVALAPKGSPQTREVRLRSTRALWDDTYVDESWINEPVRLIPRLREWIDAYYPGTKIALTEYNWGALDDMNGALAQAEVLGIFGRENVDLAALWAPEESNDPFTFAFQIYRNYDDNGSTFGDISVQSISSDSDQLSVYSALRSSDNALTVLIINKSNSDIVTTVNAANFSATGVVQGFRYSEEDKRAIRTLPEMQMVDAKLVERFPSSSFTLLIIPQAP